VSETSKTEHETVKAQIAATARLLSSASRVCILTGAGVSKESGIPTFRDAQTGLWAQYDPQELASSQGFLRDPALVWSWYDSRRKKLDDVKPNPGHYAIAEMEALFDEVMVITQNVDGLHQQAGSKNVVELHGNITTFHCFDQKHNCESVPTGLETPPLCHCGSLLRPSVVWFGEALPSGVFEHAGAAVARCDVILVVGTSGIVHPAAALPAIGKSAGAKVVEINREPTPLTSLADIVVQQESGKALPEILEQIKIIHIR
jgi:NAD-dependent deacetylase